MNDRPRPKPIRPDVPVPPLPKRPEPKEPYSRLTIGDLIRPTFSAEIFPVLPTLQMALLTNRQRELRDMVLKEARTREKWTKDEIVQMVHNVLVLFDTLDQTRTALSNCWSIANQYDPEIKDMLVNMTRLRTRLLARIDDIRNVGNPESPERSDR